VVTGDTSRTARGGFRGKQDVGSGPCPILWATHRARGRSRYSDSQGNRRRNFQHRLT